MYDFRFFCIKYPFKLTTREKNDVLDEFQRVLTNRKRN